jgi:hypothetical protein
MTSTAFHQIRDSFAQLFRFGEELVAIIPAKFVQPASRAARLWILARSLDHPCNGGGGSGLIQLSLTQIGEYLKRSERSTWRYIKEALAKGYLHRADCRDGIATIEYVGIRQLARHLGLEKIGAVGKVRLEDLPHAKTWAVDTAIQRGQANSFFAMKKEWGRFAKGAKTACDLLNSSPSSAREPGDGCIVATGHRLLYLAPHWRPFGISQEAIAKEIGVSVRTIQYRLNNRARHQAGIAPIDKRQSAHQVFPECPPEMFNALIKASDDPKRYTRLGKRLFKVGCNLYGDSTVLLKRIAYREKEFAEETGILQTINSENRVPGTTLVLQEVDFKESLVPVIGDLKILFPEKQS